MLSERMRTSIQNRKNIHFRAQFDGGTGRRIPFVVRHPSICCNIYPAEKIDIRDQIARP